MESNLDNKGTIIKHVSETIEKVFELPIEVVSNFEEDHSNNNILHVVFEEFDITINKIRGQISYCGNLEYIIDKYKTRHEDVTLGSKFIFLRGEKVIYYIFDFTIYISPDLYEPALNKIDNINMEEN